jgi:hypothetical protein
MKQYSVSEDAELVFRLSAFKDDPRYWPVARTLVTIPVNRRTIVLSIEDKQGNKLFENSSQSLSDLMKDFKKRPSKK